MTRARVHAGVSGGRATRRRVGGGRSHRQSPARRSCCAPCGRPCRAGPVTEKIHIQDSTEAQRHLPWRSGSSVSQMRHSLTLVQSLDQAPALLHTLTYSPIALPSGFFTKGEDCVPFDVHCVRYVYQAAKCAPAVACVAPRLAMPVSGCNPAVLAEDGSENRSGINFPVTQAKSAACGGAVRCCRKGFLHVTLARHCHHHRQLWEPLQAPILVSPTLFCAGGLS